jgi:transcriptional regulator with XRE-family HTH domain
MRTRPTATLAIGERVRVARLAARQTQSQLVGERYSKSYLSAVEHGKLTPSLQALEFLATRLGLPISSLLTERVLDRLPLESAEPVNRHLQKHAEGLYNHAQELIRLEWYEHAEAFLQVHLEQAHQLGETSIAGAVLGALVVLHIAKGDYARAQAQAQEALAVTQANQAYHIAGQVQLALVTVYAATHHEEAAEDAFQAALEVLERAEEPDALSQAHEQYAHFLAARKRYREAYEHLEAAQRLARPERPMPPGWKRLR